MRSMSLAAGLCALQLRRSWVTNSPLCLAGRSKRTSLDIELQVKAFDRLDRGLGLGLIGPRFKFATRLNGF